MGKRPGIRINLTPIDYFVEIIGAIGIVCLILIPVYFYNDLPGQIPKHFNALGQVDSYGNREIIWLLPAVGLFLYVGLTILNKFPFAFNYPKSVTNDNTERLYTLGTRTVRLLKVIVVLSFVFLNFKTIEIALNKSTEIGKFYLPIFLAVLIILTGTMIYKMTRK
jgi:uncharacterized membrane protein